MAETDLSIDKNKLPGVKEVCRDFAVLEDHCLAYNLQEQEIESHLASNVNKSRLVQTDLLVAKKLQEEEDLRAKGQIQKQHVETERQDNEIAQEIQEELVRQAEQQLKQEEKDAAIARKLQEKEMKEERRRQKQMESNLEEEYFEDHGAARRHLDPDKHRRHKSSSPGRHDAYAPVSSHRDNSPEYSSTQPKRRRYPRQDPAAPHSRSRYPEHPLVAEGGRSRHADPYPEHLLPSKGKHGDRYPEYEPTEPGRARGEGGDDTVVKRKEKPVRPPPPQSTIERDRKKDRQHDRDRGRDLDWEKHMVKDQRREQDPRGARAGGREDERQRERDRQIQKDKDRQRVRTMSRERGFEGDPGHSRDRPREDVFDDLELEGGGPGRERSHSRSNGETGRIVHRGSGAVVGEEFGVTEATKGLTKLDIREQELKDMEVARKLQEEEIKASKMHVRSAQVAQDEEIARLGRPEGDYRPSSEEVVRPRTRDEQEHQRQRHHNKPSRPPQPRGQDYENVNAGYGYSDHAPPRAPTRPEAHIRGAYYKR
ncbi:Coiled-coil domain containing protein 50 [Dissostichus eleginoides]|uniref:Coiled-coil domain containing protein 50 n=1 Tax=Dissostichus eleginoides TaxID=100907 RepID=A0AAD9C8S0_DISEL|nr:Coiled-coil domain containing protein 50 [Dissostichus eleginoides]